ncbi:MAG TPA: hypothetical protein VK638_19810 [Edaphobacter sp.]|nr:hypothetical protein [Edaphobacter sp.]
MAMVRQANLTFLAVTQSRTTKEKVMLKMSFTVRMKLRLKGRCSKHPRYNPEQGAGVIRGGCPLCLALYQIVAARDRATAALKVLEDVSTPYQVPRKTPRSLR